MLIQESGEAKPETESAYSDNYDEAPAGSGNEGDQTPADAPS